MNLDKPVILVTGATGRLGQLVAQVFKDKSKPWRAFARRAESAYGLGAAEVVKGSFDDRAQVAQAMASIETLILISGDDPNQDEQEIGLVQAAVSAGVKHIVKLSAQSAGLTPAVSFGKKHIKVEAAIKSSGLHWTFVRPVFFQQSFLMFAQSIRDGNKIILPGGKGSVAFVNAKDVAQCLVEAAISPGHYEKIYTLTGPRAISFSQAAGIIASTRGDPVRYIAPPAWVARIVLPKVSGMPRWLAMEVIDLLQAIAKNQQSTVTNDVYKMLGQSPRTFESFAQENASEFIKT
jgi:uncharacterized protein YbjT (DUF2867 family)